MPKTMLADRRARYRELSVLIQGVMGCDQKGPDDIARIMGVCENTAKKYIGNPELLPLDELFLLCKGLGLQFEFTVKLPAGG